MRCPKCHADVEAKAAYCPACGTRIPLDLEAGASGGVHVGDVGLLKGNIDASTSITDQSQTIDTQRRSRAT